MKLADILFKSDMDIDKHPKFLNTSPNADIRMSVTSIPTEKTSMPNISDISSKLNQINQFYKNKDLHL